jgi:hypothetical protein
MELNVGHRIRLLNLLPAEGTIVTLKVVNQLRLDLALSEEEVIRCGLRIENDRVMWDDGTYTKEIKLGEVARNLIKESLEELNQKEKLIIGDVDLWDLFVGE